METPQDHDDQLLAAGGAPAALIRNKRRIFDEFLARLRARLPAAKGEPSPIIINTLPAFTTRLALALSPGNELSFASEYSNLAFAHGNERAKMTNYSLSEVIHKYQILREIFTQVLREDASLSPQDWNVVHRSIDEAIAEAASAYVQVQQGFRDLFMAALSHDFRGPLSNSMNYLELIRRDAEPGRHGHFAARALFNLKRIDRMITELLDATRANAGAGMSLHLEQVEAGGLASEVIGDLVLRAGDRFKLEVTEPVHGWWDADRLKQALNNLLDNAVKYGREDSIITCRIGHLQGRLFLSVHNLGDPIPPETIPVLFQPFRRSVAAESSRKTGWGLGLVMVQAIAEAHGGSVSVESTPSDGTVFTLDILCDARQKAPEPEQARKDRGRPIEPASIVLSRLQNDSIDPCRWRAYRARMASRPNPLDTPTKEFTVERLLDSGTVTVRHVDCRGTCRHRSPEECASYTHFVFPYRGVYLRHVGGDLAVADANHVLFFNEGQGYQVSHPVTGGDASLVLSVSEPTLRELAPKNLVCESATFRFNQQHLRIDARAQALVMLLKHSLKHGSIESLEAEALSLTLVSRAIGPRTSRASGATYARKRLVDRVKVLLASDLSRRWTLAEIAQEIGGSPVYLTQVFQQVEGLPLYRYHLRLRLARALDELAVRADLSGLAQDLGFSSHSHFSAAFKQAYGVTPAEFRSQAR